MNLGYDSGAVGHLTPTKECDGLTDHDVGTHDTVFDFIESAGLNTAIVILIFSMYLVLQGHRRLEVIGAAATAMIGYIFAPEFHTAFMSYDLLTIDPNVFQNFIAIVFGGVGFLFMRITVRFLAAFIVFIAVYFLIQIGGRYGIDFEAGYILPGVLSIVSFFAIRTMRIVLHMVISGLLGSFGILTFAVIAFHLPTSYLDIQESYVPVLVLPMTIASLFLQKRDERILLEKKEGEDEPSQYPIYREEIQHGNTFGNTTMPLFLDSDDEP